MYLIERFKVFQLRTIVYYRYHTQEIFVAFEREIRETYSDTRACNMRHVTCDMRRVTQANTASIHLDANTHTNTHILK
jgi:hypothetical protein